MKKGFAAVLAFVLAGTAGAGTCYQFIYKNAVGDGGRVSSDSVDAVYVDSVAMIAGLGTGTGVVARYAGVVEPQKTLSVKLENEKSVETTYVKEGDLVKTGDKLFKYNTADDEDKVEKNAIDIERDQNNIETAKNQIAQLQEQVKKAKADDQLALTTQILEQENQIKQYEYEIKTKQVEIDSANAAIKNSVVVSEMDGVIKSITDPNTSGSMSLTSDESSTAFITIMATGDYRIKGYINEQNINNISEGMEVVAFSRVDNSVFWKGTIDEVKKDGGESNQNSDYGYGMSDSGTSSTNYNFYIKLESDEGLMLGQHVYIEPNVGQSEQKSGIWLPSYYFVKEDDGTNWVWAASSANKLEKRTVELGEYDEGQDTYEVVSGLNEDDYIITPDARYEEGTPVSYLDYSNSTMYGEADQVEDGAEYFESYDDMGSTFETFEGFDGLDDFDPGDGEIVEEGSEGADYVFDATIDDFNLDDIEGAYVIDGEGPADGVDIYEFDTEIIDDGTGTQNGVEG